MNCIWITIDSLRQDHVHCYAPQGASDLDGPGICVQTPNIDRLAAEGVQFDRMRAETLPTIPARRSMFTGRRLFPWPDETYYKGIYVHTNGWRPLPQEDVTIAEHLSQQGFVTALVSDVYHVMKPSMNFHRGFQCFHWERGQENDQWQSQPLPNGLIQQFIKPDTPRVSPKEGWPGSSRERSWEVLEQYLKNQMFRQSDDDYQAARTFRRAIEWLERNHEHEQFFLYIDSFDPHEPCEAPQHFLDMYDPDSAGPQLIYGNLYLRSELTDQEHHNVRAHYAAEVSMVDHWVGQVLAKVDELGLRDNTLVVLLSDHGKILGEFGIYGMPPEYTGPALNPVPCIMRHPSGEGRGQRFGGWLYNIDITATVLELLGVDPKSGNEGKNVWPAAAGGADAFRECLVCGHAAMVSAWTDDWLYLIDTDKKEASLYNLLEDSARSTDVSDRYPSVRDDMVRRVAAVADG